MPASTSNRGALRRASASFFDQAIWSLGNFVLAVGSAIWLSSPAYAQIVMVQLVYALALQAGRGAAGEATLTNRDGATPGTALTLGLLVGLAIAVPLAGIAVVFGSGALLALAFGLPALLAQDGHRYDLMRTNRDRQLVATDAAWTLLTALGVVVWGSTGRLTPTLLVALWAAGAAIPVVPAISGLVRPRAALKWLEHNRVQVRKLVAENVISRGGPPLAMLSAGSILATSDFAMVGLSRSVIAPLQLGFTAGLVVAQRELPERSGASRARIGSRIRNAMAVGGSLGAIAFALAASNYRDLLQAVTSSRDIGILVGSWAAVLAAAGWLQGERALLRTDGLGAPAPRFQAGIACAMIGGAIVGSATGEPVGTILGLAAGHWFGAFRFTRERHRREAAIGTD